LKLTTSIVDGPLWYAKTLIVDGLLSDVYNEILSLKP